MTRIFIAGFQHETNTFATAPADWAAFNRGVLFPPVVRGPQVPSFFAGTNSPTGAFMAEAATHGWELHPSVWAGASPSARVTRDAFERIAAALLEDLRAALARGIDGIYLDLHGAAVAEHVDDCEGELLARIRELTGPALPIVASLDLHANVSDRMLALSDALVAYRTYPHVDVAATGALAAQLLLRRLQRGAREPMQAHRLPFLISLNAQATWLEPARSHYDRLRALDAQYGTISSFCMGFPASDTADCGPVVWSCGEQAVRVAQALFDSVSEPAPWRFEALDAKPAVEAAVAAAVLDSGPIVIADTQDNPGAGGQGNTTGLLHALLEAGVGRRWPGQVALGLLWDPAAAEKAHALGVGAVLETDLGRSVALPGGRFSEPPVHGAFTVTALGDGECTLKGPMMNGTKAHLGLCALLSMDGIGVAVVSKSTQLFDREMLRLLGLDAQNLRLIVVKSSNHFRADFEPIAGKIIVAKAPGPMPADPADLPWTQLPASVRRRP